MKWQKINYTETKKYTPEYIRPNGRRIHEGYDWYDRDFKTEDGQSIRNVPYLIKYPDGTVKKGNLCDDTYENKKDVNFKPKLYLGKTKYVYDRNKGDDETCYVYPKTILNHEEIMVMDFDNVKIEIVYPFLKVGQYVDVAGIRDTNSFRKIIGINDYRIFCEKWFITKQTNELKMEYTSSDNGIEKIKGIYNEELLRTGNFLYTHDFSDKEILKIVKEKY
jgi:hypothetical protein